MTKNSNKKMKTKFDTDKNEMTPLYFGKEKGKKREGKKNQQSPTIVFSCTRTIPAEKS